MAEYRDNLIKEAEALILHDFPAKVLKFDEILKSPEFSHERLAEVLPDINSIIPMPKLVDPNSQMEVDLPTKKIRSSETSSKHIMRFSNNRIFFSASLCFCGRSRQIERKIDWIDIVGPFVVARDRWIDQQIEDLDNVLGLTLDSLH